MPDDGAGQPAIMPSAATERTATATSEPSVNSFGMSSPIMWHRLYRVRCILPRRRVPVYRDARSAPKPLTKNADRRYLLGGIAPRSAAAAAPRAWLCRAPLGIVLAT